MSTKIFSVYMWTGRGGLDGVYEFLMERKTAFAARHRAMEARYIAETCAWEIDKVAVGRPAIWQDNLRYPRSYYSHVLYDRDERRKKIKREGHRDTFVDFDFEVWVLPHDGNIVLRPNSEQRDQVTWFLDGAPLDDYHYQNSADKPEGIDDEEWAERKAFWEAALPSGVFADKCMTFDLHPSMYSHFRIPDMDEIIAHVPSLDDRARKMAEDQITGEQMPKARVGDMGDFFGDLRKASRYVRDNPEEVLQRVAHLKTVLPVIDVKKMTSHPPHHE